MSNRSLTAAVLVFLVVTAGCGGQGFDANANNAIALSQPGGPPFQVTEPDRFRADIFIRTAGIEIRRSYFRDGLNRKLVIFDEAGPASELIDGGTRYAVDHKRRIYTQPAELKGFDPDFIQDMTVRRLREREYAVFEDLGISGTVRTFRATLVGKPDSVSTIYFDESLGLITKQEFATVGSPEPDMVFELKNVSTDVAADTFSVPDGYRKVTEKDFYNGS